MARKLVCISILLLGCFLGSNRVWAVDFGETGTGDDYANGAVDILGASQFVCPSNGVVNTIRLRVWAAGTGSGRVALYAESASNTYTPGALMAESSSQALVSGAWNSFSIPGQSVTAGQRYWLALQLNNNNTYINTEATPPAYICKTTSRWPVTYGSFPNPFNLATDFYPWAFCINATEYTATPTPTHTRTATQSATQTLTYTPTATPSSTPTPGNSATSTQSATLTGTPSITLTATPSPTLTPSASHTPSPTITKTSTATSIFTPTTTPTVTSTFTVTRTCTVSATSTISVTSTISITATASLTVTKTLTVTSTPTIRKSEPNLSNVLVYPNPWRGDFPGIQPRVIFRNLSQNPIIYIYTLDGNLVRRLETGIQADNGWTTNPGDNGQASWGLTNAQGQPVATGVYIYVIKDLADHEARGKIAVLR